MELDRELEVAKELALSAGKKIMEIYNRTDSQVSYKEDRSPLTEADTQSNTIIMNGLRKEFPDDGFLTEEEKDSEERLEKQRVWIVDPLDGTKEFIKHTGEFTVNIALTINGSPEIGVVYVPALDELYFSARGKGAFAVRNGKKEKLAVSNREKINEMLLAVSRDHSTEEEKKLSEHFAGTEARGSSLKGLMIAEGKAEAYFRAGPVNQWDICAMESVLTEAGGMLTDLTGNRIRYNTRETLIKGFLASNNRAHREILALIDRIRRGE
ncbi:3'(2'),5'-bisphosphate nucleotidase CysQ [Candidatus Woesearchaeota archaeon]|nr:MAG: 3'(2'),5'-bisphosphate nucleotidase CysQ [Candidatus Woesearchaeota archaeon]